MKDLVKKVAVGLSTAALLANSLVLPSFATLDVVVSGNGSDTNNNVNVTSDNATVVEQSNEAVISNNVQASADTGKNDANDNTGGDVSIDTGNAESTVEVSNTVNSNEAKVDCGGCPGDVNVEVSGNGSHSENEVELELSKETFLTQENYADISNDVDVKANTGKNDADDNTGGEVSIDTGWAEAVAVVKNQANANVAHVGGNGDGALELLIKGNGSYSDNDIDVDLANAVVIDQANWADIENDVEVNANTGKNDANDNTGGGASIDTGSAFAGALVDNMANFNLAHVEDCCELDGLVKVAGNGTDSENEVELELTSFLGASQGNAFGCEEQDGWFEWWWQKNDCNDVEVKADTGKNEVDDNTGNPGDDPSVDTGNATTEVEVNNTGNSNVFATGEAFSPPEWANNWQDGNFNWFLWLLAGSSQG